MLKLRIPRYPASVVLRRAALAYLIIWQLSPPLAYGTIWRALAVLAMLLWLALDTLSARSVLLRPNWRILAAVGYVAYTVLIEWLVPDALSINSQFQLWIMLFFMLVGESSLRGNEGEARFCFWVVLLVLPVWMTTTLFGINTIAGDAARTVTRSSVEARELSGQGVGGFSLVYAAVLCLPFLAHLALHARTWAAGLAAGWRRRAAKLLVIVNAAIAVVLVLQAGYSIALILTFSVISCVVLVRSRRPSRLFISLTISGLIALTVLMAAKPVLGVLEDAATGTEYSAKLRDIRYSMEEDQSTGTVEDRWERYVRSLRLFFENPIMGTLRFDDVGKHSAVLDKFAQYGFLVGLLFLGLLVHWPVAMFKQRSVPIGAALGFLLVASLFPMLNNVFMSWGLMLYVFSRGAVSVMQSAGMQTPSTTRPRVMVGHA